MGIRQKQIPSGNDKQRGKGNTEILELRSRMTAFAHPGEAWMGHPAGVDQEAAATARFWHDRWCFSRSVFVFSWRSSLCRARLRIADSLSPSKILGGSCLIDAAAASSNCAQILHCIFAFTLLKRTPL
jgi:hypothetical protein